MSDRRVRISISDLPFRSRGPSGPELERVFGGFGRCGEKGAGCQRDSDCCKGSCRLVGLSLVGNCYS